MDFQKNLYAIGSILDPPNDFESLLSLYTSHAGRLNEGVTAELTVAGDRTTNLDSMYAHGGNEEKASFYRLENNNQQKYYVKIMLEEMKGGRDVGPLHLANVLLLFTQFYGVDSGKARVGHYSLNAIVNAVKVALLANATNVAWCRAGQDTEPLSVEWYAEKLGDLQREVRKN